MLHDTEFLRLHFSQLVKAWKLARYNSYSDALKQSYHENLASLFGCLKDSDFSSLSFVEQQEYKEIIDFFMTSLQFLNDSTVNNVPYEIVECLRFSLEEWIDNPDQYIIVTSYNDYSFNRTLVTLKTYTIIEVKFNIRFDRKLVQINLPKHLSNDYLCNAVLYHELGHFIDIIQNLHVPIVAAIMANSTNKDCQKYFYYLNNPAFDTDHKKYFVSNHVKEYFADIFATQYIREASYYYLSYIAGRNGTSETHPSTKNRISLVDEFLGDPSSYGFVLNTIIGEVRKQIARDINKRFVSLSKNDFLDLIPFNIENKNQIHYLFYLGWETWLNHQDKFQSRNNMSSALQPSQIYQIINNLIEKSINNYLIVEKWNNTKP